MFDQVDASMGMREITSDTLRVAYMADHRQTPGFSERHPFLERSLTTLLKADRPDMLEGLRELPLPFTGPALDPSEAEFEYAVLFAASRVLADVSRSMDPVEAIEALSVLVECTWPKVTGRDSGHWSERDMLFDEINDRTPDTGATTQQMSTFGPRGHM
jgi:hypothetical protein